MWRLAHDMTWGPAESRSLVLVESALAFPSTAVCVECEEEGKQFSKSQLARHPDERRCRDCVERTLSAVYRPSATAAQSASALPQVMVCSVCKVQLTKQISSASQRQKIPSKRKCNSCVGVSPTLPVDTVM